MTKLQVNKFSDNATITFVPTAAGASGLKEIEVFLQGNRLSLSTFFETSASAIKYHFQTPQIEVEELLVRFEFNQTFDWLLPGVRPNQQPVQLPVVSCTSYDDQGLIQTWRVYWDQATVLRQIGLLPSDPAKLPLNKVHPVHADIVPALNGQQAASRFLDEVAFPANPLLHQLSGMVETGRLEAVKLASPRKTASRGAVGDLLSGQSAPEVVRPSTKLNSKYVGGKPQVNIFDSAEVQNEKPRANVDPRRYETHFDQESEDMKLGKLRSHDPRTNASHFSLQHDSSVHASEPSHAGKRRNEQFSNNESHIFDYQDDNVAAAAKNSPQKNKQTFSIWESSSNGAGTLQSRPSSRVLRAPGGGSSIQLF